MTEADIVPIGTDPGWTTRLMVYRGQRRSIKGNALDSFLDLDIQSVRNYQHKRGDRSYAIGRTYQVEVNDTANTARMATAKLCPDRMDVDSPTVAAWTAESVAQAAQAATERLEATLAKDGALDAHLDALADAYGAVSSYERRAAFLAYVTARVTGNRRSAR